MYEAFAAGLKKVCNSSLPLKDLINLYRKEKNMY